jgi:hypothetical protein
MATSGLISRTPNIFYFDGYATTWLIAGEANFPPDKKLYRQHQDDKHLQSA